MTSKHWRRTPVNGTVNSTDARAHREKKQPVRTKGEDDEDGSGRKKQDNDKTRYRVRVGGRRAHVRSRSGACVVAWGRMVRAWAMWAFLGVFVLPAACDCSTAALRP